MWVGEGGDILGSVTIGGCVDAYVIEQAEAVLADQVPRLIELPLGDEDAWELGSRVRGRSRSSSNRSAAHSQPFDLYTALKSHLDSGARALLTCLDGATMGAKLLLLDDGTTSGRLATRRWIRKSARRRYPIWRRGCRAPCPWRCRTRQRGSSWRSIHRRLRSSSSEPATWPCCWCS